MNPIQKALATADVIQAENRKLEELTEEQQLSQARTPDLVREFADIKGWFRVASHGGWAKGKLAAKKHERLGKVVNELRNRGILD